ncbi:hypothetical protein FGO68_gene15229 [Halteria grandinella]|uniref:Uncharacterized protein n=1 Tax=Halteria grandinella TaxID=5974 RepID=A0A8J8SZJ5_HALGN|nr:hypothetical protein FGO68_gene15229 [Halteria grandinella]
MASPLTKRRQEHCLRGGETSTQEVIETPAYQSSAPIIAKKVTTAGNKKPRAAYSRIISPLKQKCGSPLKASELALAQSFDNLQKDFHDFKRDIKSEVCLLKRDMDDMKAQLVKVTEFMENMKEAMVDKAQAKAEKSDVSNLSSVSRPPLQQY